MYSRVCDWHLDYVFDPESCKSSRPYTSSFEIELYGSVTDTDSRRIRKELSATLRVSNESDNTYQGQDKMLGEIVRLSLKYYSRDKKGILAYQYVPRNHIDTLLLILNSGRQIRDGYKIYRIKPWKWTHNELSYFMRIMVVNYTPIFIISFFHSSSYTRLKESSLSPCNSLNSPISTAL